MYMHVENEQKIRGAFKITLFMVAVALMTVSCSSSQGMGDLQSYVSGVLAKKGGRIAPLPAFKMYETFSYSAYEYRDPFRMIREDVVQENEESVSSNNGLKPDVNRNKEVLEQYPLDALRFVGHLEKDGTTWAIITSPDNLVHRVQIGNYLGQNYGQIVAISETNIEVVELVQDGRGGWIERSAGLALRFE